jgi:hypothetical protein
MDFEETPIEIALESFPHMSKHLRLQYDGKPPPLLLALAPKNDEKLKMVHTEAQKIYKDINLRVDHLNEQTVGAYYSHLMHSEKLVKGFSGIGQSVAL